VWDVKTSDERAHVPSMVVWYLLGRHFNVPEGCGFRRGKRPLILHCDCRKALRCFIRGLPVDRAGFKGAMMAFDQLVKGLKSLDNELPLSLVNVSPVTECLRYTSVFSPVALPPHLATSIPQCWSYFPAMEIILEFEKSGRWPDDLRAVQKIKLALFERVASALMNSKQGLKATVVVGDDVVAFGYSRSVETSADGWAFFCSDMARSGGYTLESYYR